MSRHELVSHPFESAPEPLKPDVNIQYSLPFEWGSFHVSETAHNLYGLVPLLANPVEGYKPQSGDRPSTSQIFLVAPGEMRTPELRPTEDYVRPVIHKSGVDFVLSQGHLNAERMGEQVSASLLRAMPLIMGIDPEDFQANIEEIGITPDFLESLEDIQPQRIIHELTYYLSQEATSPVEAWLRTENAADFYKRLRWHSALYFGAAAVGTTVSTIPNHLTVTPFGATLGVGYVLLGANNARQTIKQRLKNENFREQLVRLNAKLITAQTADDIHRAYCRYHFNDEFNANDFPVDI